MIDHFEQRTQTGIPQRTAGHHYGTARRRARPSGRWFRHPPAELPRGHPARSQPAPAVLVSATQHQHPTGVGTDSHMNAGRNMGNMEASLASGATSVYPKSGITE